KYFIAGGSLTEDQQVEIPVRRVDAQAVVQGRDGGTQKFAVFGGNGAIAVQVGPFEIAGFCPGLNGRSFRPGIDCDLFRVLKYTQDFIAVKRVVSMSHLGPLEVMREILNPAGPGFGKINFITKIGHFVGGMRDVSIDSQAQFAEVPPVTEFEFQTGGLQIGQVNGRIAKSYVSGNRLGAKDTGRFFPEPVEAERKVPEQGSIQADVQLAGLFPGQVRVSRRIGACPDVHVVNTENVVTATAHANGGNVLKIPSTGVVANHAVGCPYFQVIQNIIRHP